VASSNFDCLFGLCFSFSDIYQMSVSAQFVSESKLTHPPAVIVDQTSDELHNGNYDNLLPDEDKQRVCIHDEERRTIMYVI
jgi:hypothetical protein